MVDRLVRVPQDVALASLDRKVGNVLGFGLGRRSPAQKAEIISHHVEPTTSVDPGLVSLTAVKVNGITYSDGDDPEIPIVVGGETYRVYTQPKAKLDEVWDPDGGVHIGPEINDLRGFRWSEHAWEL